MKLKVKDVDLSTGGPLIAILNQEDAAKLDLHALDRISVKRDEKEVIAVVNLAESEGTIPNGKVGLFEEVLDKLNVKENDIVDISLEKKPYSVQYIKRKLDGGTLTESEINNIVRDVVNNNLSDIELTYFVSGCYINRLNMNETIALTRAIVNSGEQLKLERYPVVDKHCSGGVPGNRTTMLIVPIVAAAGLTIPKTSSRAITSPAGTADSMEVLTNVSLPVEEIRKVVERTNGCMVWGGAMELASADDKLIKIESPLRVDPEGMLLSSIIAKKVAVGATHVLIDIPIGIGAKIESRNEAVRLKRDFIRLAKKLGLRVKVMFSDGSQPVGNGIGPVLEARDVLWILEGNEKGPEDLKKKSVYMAGLILKMAGMRNGMRRAIDILESGKAYEKMKEIIKEQGGNPDIKADELKLGRYSYVVKAKKEGIVRGIDNQAIAKIARIAGAPTDKEAGVYLYVKRGERVSKESPLFAVYAKNSKKLNYTLDVFKDMKVVEIA